MENTLSVSEVSELVCTRISHDLIGNIGAVSNAVELLEEGDMDFMDDIRSILKVSSGVLTARLKFFRMAFGVDNANLEKLDLVEKTTADYLKTLGNVNYPISLTMRLSNWQLSKMAMLAVMILADTFIKGGNIEVREETGRLLILAAAVLFYIPLVANRSAEKISAVAAAVNGKLIERTAQYAPVFYLQELLSKFKLKLNIIEDKGFGLSIE